MRIAQFPLLTALLFSLSSCSYTFYTMNGHKFKESNLLGDQRKAYWQNPNRDTLQAFSLREIKTGTHDSGNTRFEILNVQNLKSLSSKHEKLVALFILNPQCHSFGKNFSRYVKYLEAHKIPNVIISTSYDTKSLRSKFDQLGIHKDVVYIIPSDLYSGKAIIKMKLFMRDLCLPCYKDFQDEVMFAQALVLEKGKVSEVKFRLDF